jgi:predicted phosphate transport protein (TIGR00153 family)
MFGWFQKLLPREDRFFELFNRHSQTLVEGAKALRDLLEGGDAVPAACERITAYENEADIVTRDVMLAVRRTFITPFDRGDIKDLISLLDDAIDQMHKTAKTIMLFEVRTFAPAMRELGDIIVAASQLTHEAIPLLAAMSQNAGRINTITEQVVRLEERADEMTDKGIKALYLATRDGNPMDFIVGTEIYDHLEKVVDRFEDVANRISGVVIEHI